MQKAKVLSRKISPTCSEQHTLKGHRCRNLKIGARLPIGAHPFSIGRSIPWPRPSLPSPPPLPPWNMNRPLGQKLAFSVQSQSGGPPYNACVFYPSTSWRVHPNPLFPFQLLLVYAYKVKPLTRIAPHSLTKVMILKKKPVYVTGSHFH